jgi:mannose-1-phosphate guanylyltransferase
MALNKSHLYVVILCGGGGTRLWPLSRNNSPKQFIDLVGSETLFTKTLKRAQKLVDNDHIFIMTNKSYSTDVEKYAKGVPKQNIITEPEKKNTALAMGVIAGIIHVRDKEAVIINFASDHLITDDQVFIKSMLVAANVASGNKYIVAVGITPLFAHTGLGYIHADGKIGEESGLPILKVEGFREKPDEVTAQKFLAAGHYYWNANLYTWSTKLILAEFAQLAPELYGHIVTIMQSIGTPQFEEVLAVEYSHAKEEQIDTAISEKTENLAVIPGNFGWTDIGSWNVVHDEVEKDTEGNALISREEGGDWFRLDTTNSLVSTGKKQIVTIGLDNVIIVDTDDAILVIHKDRAQDVKKVVEHFKKTGKNKLL